MYLQQRWSRHRFSTLLRHFLQFLALTMAWFTALSRVSDYKHHWSDVLAGSVQGTVVAIIIVSIHSEFACCTNLFPLAQQRSECACIIFQSGRTKQKGRLRTLIMRLGCNQISGPITLLSCVNGIKQRFVDRASAGFL